MGEFRLGVPGLHNVRNALAAIASGIALGVAVPMLVAGLESFGGVERRFQHVADARGVTIIDDYAHHPTEIAATLDAARAAYPGRRLVAAFQPHLYTRTRDFAADFGRVLARADVVMLADLYPAREQPIEGVSAALVGDAVVASGGRVAWQGKREGLAKALVERVQDGDVVITIGAGDITKTATELRDLIAG